MLFFDAFGLCVGILIFVENLLLYSGGKGWFGIDEGFAVAGFWYVEMERWTVLGVVVSAFFEVDFVDFRKWEGHCAGSVHWWAALGIHG